MSSPSRVPLLVATATTSSQQLLQQPQYSALTGLVYVFNVIVGTGALAIPGVVATSGYVLSSFVLILLAFISYMTVTFVIESMAISNALLSKGSRGGINEETEEDETEENEENFDINTRVEMGTMASMYFNPIGKGLFYTCIVVYLYGDLSIYITAVSKSLRDVTCHQSPDINITVTTTTCNNQYTTESSIYKLYTIAFMLVISPFAFMNISKTKYLQMTTTILRWSAFISMIFLSVSKIISDNTTPAHRIPRTIANFSDLPRLFGVSIYSFMCHHSLPSLVTPVKNKSQLKTLFLLDYVLITFFYIFLSVTGVFAFDKIQDLYTLNFVDDGLLGILLGLFPVFTLSTNFPIIAITLKNNLTNLFIGHGSGGADGEYFNWILTCLAVLPPFFVSFFIEDVHFLVNFTGAFAGVGIQYFIPVFIVYTARKRLLPSSGINPYKSPFEGSWWLFAVIAFGVGCVGFVVVDLFFL